MRLPSRNILSLVCVLDPWVLVCCRIRHVGGGWLILSGVMVFGIVVFVVGSVLKCPRLMVQRVLFLLWGELEP